MESDKQISREERCGGEKLNAYRDVREHSVHDSEARIRKDLEGRDQVENLQKTAPICQHWGQS
jgi:hypothetical protein